MKRHVGQQETRQPLAVAVKLKFPPTVNVIINTTSRTLIFARNLQRWMTRSRNEEVNLELRIDFREFREPLCEAIVMDSSFVIVIFTTVWVGSSTL